MAILLSRDLLRGLKHIHDKGWLHRDLKPMNILISQMASSLALNFGLEKGEIGMKGDYFGPYKDYLNQMTLMIGDFGLSR